MWRSCNNSLPFQYNAPTVFALRVSLERTADPLRLLRLLRARNAMSHLENWPRFRDFLIEKKFDYILHDVTNMADLLLDTTGRLRDASYQFLKGREG